MGHRLTHQQAVGPRTGAQAVEADEPPPPPPLTAAGRLELCVQRLALREAFANLPRASHGHRDRVDRARERLETAGHGFLYAIASFTRGVAFDADGEVSTPLQAAQHVITAAERLDMYRGVRKEASESGAERLMKAYKDHGEPYDRVPGEEPHFPSFRLPAPHERGLPAQLIDELVERARSQTNVPLHDLVDELDLGTLDEATLRRLEWAVITLNIPLGSRTDASFPRNALGLKFDAAYAALGLREHRNPRAHAAYVESAP
ncbi:hypothetical protein GHT07_03430 [Caenimonas koreensis DSM 17982]|uniref:Uncharacterized protein n=1 Tax=Caenimonas koreensis DSM 17982 TaxID=1121255 RepID=A0A844AQ90_9BURK|nr:hypothetical protein [Caenimonas koreensis]MRD46315.1 hypothetical protein [Caenimonas koreensis DSM 17982]